MITQTVRLVKNCFSLEFDCKKAGRTNKSTPIMYTTCSNLLIITYSNKSLKKLKP